MPKHTKGPWRRGNSKYVIRAKPDPGSHRKPTDEQIVVQVRANQKYRKDEYDEANAALIADAPAMWLVLELLRCNCAHLNTGELGLFVFNLGPGSEEYPFTGDWTALVDAIGWDRCYEKLALR